MPDAMFRQAYPLALRSTHVRSAAAALSGAVLLADRADLEQEVLIRVWQALSRYDPARAGLRTFIEMVVGTQFTSMLRSHRRRPEFEPLDERQVAGDGGFRDIERRESRAAPASLKPTGTLRWVRESRTGGPNDELSRFLGN